MHPWMVHMYVILDRGYTLEPAQAVGIVEIVWMVGIFGLVVIRLLTKGQAIRSFIVLVVIIEVVWNLVILDWKLRKSFASYLLWFKFV